MERILQGSIVWVEVHDLAGRNAKCRPAVVITATDDIEKSDTVVVAAATTKFDKPPPDDMIPLPWSRRRHPVTGLYRPCVVVCSWLAEVRISDIRDVAGVVPAHILEAILLRTIDDP